MTANPQSLLDARKGDVIIATTNTERRVYEKIQDGEEDEWARTGNQHTHTSYDIAGWADGWMKLIPGPPPGPYYPPTSPTPRPWG